MLLVLKVMLGYHCGKLVRLYIQRLPGPFTADKLHPENNCSLYNSFLSLLSMNFQIPDYRNAVIVAKSPASAKRYPCPFIIPPAALLVVIREIALLSASDIFFKKFYRQREP